MYGMCVTNPLAYDIEYNDFKGWKTLDEISEEESAEKLAMLYSFEKKGFYNIDFKLFCLNYLVNSIAL